MSPTSDYFLYLPENSICEALGATALSVGHTRITPGSPYPPVRHPDDHHFVWERGRTLQAYQFALISEGSGRLQCAPDAEQIRNVRAGDVILLVPGIWHRFAPDPETGWTENWIECRGPAFDHALDIGIFDPSKPLWAGGAEAEACFAEIHSLAVADALLNQPILSALGLRLLAALAQSRRLPGNADMRLYNRARRTLIEESGRPRPLEQLAADLGVSYTTLRRVFRLHAGMSLKQYQTDVRIRRACELLRSSNKSVKEIAGHLGYSSAFHFSAQFSKITGLAPSVWREANGPRWLVEAAQQEPKQPRK